MPTGPNSQPNTKARQAAQKKYNAKPKEYILSNAKSRARKKGWDFDLTVDDFEIPEYCPVFKDMKLSLLANVGTKDNRPSLDRIDCTKGYVKGNVRIISWRANNLISDGSLDEFRKIVEFLENDDPEKY